MDSSKPYAMSEVLRRNLRAIDDATLKQRKAGLIIIDGGLGQGKTTLAVLCIEELQGFPIDFEAQLAMGGDEFSKKLDLCAQKGYHYIIYDEAGDFNKRGALTKFNRALDRIFDTYRALNIIPILTLPNFDVLSSNIFDNNLPRLLLNTYGRSLNQGNYRGYSFKRMLDIRELMRKLNRKKQLAYKMVTPSFYGHFKDLPKEQAAALDKIGTAKKREFVKKSNRSIEGLITYEELSKAVGKSMNWTRQTVSRMKIAPAREEGKRRYFNQEAINTIQHALRKKK